MTKPTAQELRDQAAELLRRSVELDSTQLDKAALAGMTSAEIVEAKEAGRLNDLLGISNPTTKESQ
jgi:hypothetical protein